MAADTAPKNNLGGKLKKNKVAIVVAGGGALVYMISKGHSSNAGGATASTGTSDGTGGSDSSSVQLIPVSTGPAEASNLDSVGNANNGASSDGVSQVPSNGGQASGSTDSPITDTPYPISIGGDLNSPIFGPDVVPPGFSTLPAIVSGPAASGAIAAGAAHASAKKPPGHPGYGGGNKAKPKPKSPPKSTPKKPSHTLDGKPGQVGGKPIPHVPEHPAAKPTPAHVAPKPKPAPPKPAPKKKKG